MPNWSYYQYGRTQFCWNTKKQARVINPTPANPQKFGFGAWKSVCNRNMWQRGKIIWFKRRKKAAARALQWYRTAMSSSKERMALNSDDLDVKIVAMRRKAERLRERNESVKAANLDMKASALEVERDLQRAAERERKDAMIEAEVGPVPEHMKQIVEDAIDARDEKREKEAKKERREKAIRKTESDIKRWTRKHRLATTKLKKLKAKLKRLTKV